MITEKEQNSIVAKVATQVKAGIREDLAELMKAMASQKESSNGKNGSKVGEAQLRLVNLLYDTDPEKYIELTRIPRNQVLPLSIMLTKVAARDPKRKDPLAKVWSRIYCQLMRSVDGRHLMLGNAIAQEQVGAMEKEEEKSPWDEDY